jgi:hypothetical protein
VDHAPRRAVRDQNSFLSIANLRGKSTRPNRRDEARTDSILLVFHLYFVVSYSNLILARFLLIQAAYLEYSQAMMAAAASGETGPTQKSYRDSIRV